MGVIREAEPSPVRYQSVWCSGIICGSHPQVPGSIPGTDAQQRRGAAEARLAHAQKDVGSIPTVANIS